MKTCSAKQQETDEGAGMVRDRWTDDVSSSAGTSWIKATKENVTPKSQINLKKGEVKTPAVELQKAKRDVKSIFGKDFFADEKRFIKFPPCGQFIAKCVL